MTTSRPITLIIADDHPLFRSGVRGELEDAAKFHVVGEADNGRDALAMIGESKPDAAILDFQMPHLTGLEVTRALAEAHSTTRVILLTMHRDKKIFYAALDAGVWGYVLKDDAIADIVKAVVQVASGEHFISGNLTGLLLEKVRKTGREHHAAHPLDTLTPAEHNILKRVAELKSNDEIAAELFISKRTIENHKVAIADKLGLESAKRLLRFALQNKEELQ